MRPNEHTRRLHAHLDLAAKGVRSTVEFALKETIFGVPPTKRPEVLEVVLDTTIGFPVYPFENIKKVGSTHSPEVRFGGDRDVDLFQMDDQVKSLYAYCSLSPEHDGETLADTLVGMALDAAEKFMNSEDMAAIVDGYDDMRETALYSAMRTVTDNYALDGKGRVFKRLPTPVYKMEVVGNDSLLHPEFRTEGKPYIELDKFVVGGPIRGMESLLAFAHDETRGYDAIEKFLEGKAATSRDPERILDSRITLNRPTSTPLLHAIQGLRAVQSAVQGFRPGDLETKKLVRAMEKAVEYRAGMFEDKELEKISSIAVDLDEILMDKHADRFQQALKQNGWKLTVSPLNIFSRRVEAHLDMKNDVTGDRKVSIAPKI